MELFHGVLKMATAKKPATCLSTIELHYHGQTRIDVVRDPDATPCLLSFVLMDHDSWHFITSGISLLKNDEGELNLLKFQDKSNLPCLSLQQLLFIIQLAM
jgi:hypothetical protein